METAAKYATEPTSVHRENDVRLQAVHSILDRLHIQPGQLVTRLTNLFSRDRLMRQSLSDAMGSREIAIDALTKLTRQLSLPAGAEGLIAESIRAHNIRIQVELEQIVAGLARMEPDYLQVEPVKELVMASQELMDCTEDILTEMYDCFVKGDPLLKRLRHSKATTSLALATIRSKRAYGGQS